MSLTAQQENFCQAIADGMTQSDAYRTAYKAGAMKDATIHKRASELIGNGAVAGRVNELKASLAEKVLWSREKSVLGLAKIADDAGSKPAETIAAIKELNSMHGFQAPTKSELTVTFPKVINVIAGRA